MQKKSRAGIMVGASRRKLAPRFHRREHMHVEAYPALNVRVARKHALAGHHHVLWLDQRGRVHGQGFAVLKEHELDFSWHMRGFREEDDISHQRTFALKITNGDIGQTDCFTKCQNCNSKIRVVVLVDGIWACSDCQGLTWRSNLLGQVGRKSEKLMKLEEKLAGGRPKGMHSTTYDCLKAELDELKLEVGTPLVSSSAYSDVITAWWQSDGPVLMNKGELILDAPTSGDWG